MIKNKNIVVIIFILVLIFIIDFSMMFLFKMHPIFVIRGNIYIDGGSVEYYGLGYKVLQCKTLSGDNSIKIGLYNMKYSCNTNSSLSNTNFIIIDETKVCAEALELFYTDDYYNYYFPCIQSEYIYIKYDNGYKALVKEALMNNLVTIQQLEDKGLKIYKYNKFEVDVTESNNCEIKEIIKDVNKYDAPMPYSIYSYCLDDIRIIIDNNKYSLYESLSSSKISMDKIIAKLDYSSTYAQVIKKVYKDGGSVMYSTFTYSILKCNTLSGNKDYYIGKSDMEYEEGFCK